MQAPPGRYRIEERDGRLNVIDQWAQVEHRPATPATTVQRDRQSLSAGGWVAEIILLHPARVFLIALSVMFFWIAVPAAIFGLMHPRTNPWVKHVGRFMIGTDRSN
jgi:hypothetical protein